MKKICFVLSAVLLFSCVSIFGGCGKEPATTEYQINCELNGSEVIANESVDYYNGSSEVLSFIMFNLYPNAYRKGAKYPAVDKSYAHLAYYDGESYGEIDIISVKSRGQVLDYEITGEDQNILKVNLVQELFPSERVKIDIEFKVSLAKVISRTGITKKTVNLADFYPVACVRDESGFYECVYYSYGDPFYSEASNYKVNITVDKEYNVASSGTISSVKTMGDRASYSMEIDNARSFAIVLSKDFESIKKEVLGVEVNYCFLSDENPLEVISAVEKAITFFTEKFGEFPYKSFTVVETPFNEGGMEYSGLCYISDELTRDEKIEVAVHETAHQWWQSAVGNNGIEYPFLDEGLAEYSVVLFYENHTEYGLTREELIKEAKSRYRLYASVYSEVFGKVDTSMLKPIPKFNGAYEYVSICYVKACLMLDNLREVVGEKDFYSVLKSYYSEYAFKNATPDHLVASFLKEFREAEGFFNGFFSGKAIL